MTRLNKPIKRETVECYQHRPLIIQIDPADPVHKVPTMIRIKEKGRRIWYEIPLTSVWVEAAKRYGQVQRIEKLKDRARRGIKTAQDALKKMRVKY